MDTRVSQPRFEDYLRLYGQPALTRAPLRNLQINLGYLCNQACEHCHVEAGPRRSELMSWATMEKILGWMEESGVQSVDLTGGAPEMNPHFRPFVDASLALGAGVISRCNLTILNEPGYEDLTAWYAERKVELVSSLPCYTQENVDAQRGKGVFDRSIRALQGLNAAGYGIDADKPLSLVYNPGGAFLPPAQEKLESDYKQQLSDEFGIEFTQLLTITNLPINRFAHFLRRTEQYDDYLQLLADNFNAATLEGLMCRHLLSIDWQGRAYDCDFNQMLHIGLNPGLNPELKSAQDQQLHSPDTPFLWEISAQKLQSSEIATGAHCFGCTAGAGSSCGGALAD